MLVAQPVRGLDLDIGAIEKVHKTLLELKAQGESHPSHFGGAV